MTPFISVIIPTCNRNDLLAKCLNQLAPGAQALEADLYEVIVSDDGTTESARQMLSESYTWAKWVEGPRRGPAANRNNGARHAAGQWLAFVDDDCVPDEIWLKSIQTCAQESGADVVEGKVVIPDKVDNPFLRGVENLNGGLYWSCNISVRRRIFEVLGGFDEDFLEAGGEDMEFAWRFKSNGVRAQFCRDALVLHPVRVHTMRTFVWRVGLYRWMALFYHKTGQATPLTESACKALSNLCVRETTNQLRRTWYFVSRSSTTGLCTRTFDLIWGWVSFPFMLANLLVWELRFRKMLLARRDKRTP